MRRIFSILAMVSLVVMTGCEGIDCTLNNIVSLNVGFYSSSDGLTYAEPDTLTVTAEGTDSVLCNRSRGRSSITLPVSYWQEADTLNFNFYNSEESHRITLRIRKTNKLHYESPDCPTTMFHTIQGIESIGGQGYIDSVVVVNPNINYASYENIRIYFHLPD